MNSSSSFFSSRFFFVSVSMLALFLGLVLYLVLDRASLPEESVMNDPVSDVVEYTELSPVVPRQLGVSFASASEIDASKLGKAVSMLWGGASKEDVVGLLPFFSEKGQPVFISVRSGGRRISMLWEDPAPDLPEVIYDPGLSSLDLSSVSAESSPKYVRGSSKEGRVVDVLALALERVRHLSGSQVSMVDEIYVEFSHSYKDVPSSFLWDGSFPSSDRALIGVEVGDGSRVLRYGPGRFVETNRRPSKVVSCFKALRELEIRPSLDSVPLEDLLESDSSEEVPLVCRTFKAEQFWVPLGRVSETVRMVRGSVPILPSEVTQDSVGNWLDLASGWMWNNVSANGELTYIYWPSQEGSPSDLDNMIRRWMASVALVRLGKEGHASGSERDFPESEKLELATRNIWWNLAAGYKRDGDFGMIVEKRDGDVKLGAIALAALAILEHPESGLWDEEFVSLCKTVDHLWNEDGSFRTFYRPAGRNDNENFYPGEALLFWAGLYAKTKDPVLLDKFMKSFAYYKKWHLNPKNRNPAFVPWHTQAYFQMWKITGDPALRDFVFEMNDWLVGLQQWDLAAHPDEMGQFYAPGGRFGPSHASSTGVYVEGLIDAYVLARDSGEPVKAETYRLAIARACRNLMQLQYSDDSGMFYLSKKGRAAILGGLKTSPWDNEIRCDNIQHPLMGILRVKREFLPEDYSVDPK